jgi:hypothetical protein
MIVGHEHERDGKYHVEHESSPHLARSWSILTVSIILSSVEFCNGLAKFLLVENGILNLILAEERVDEAISRFP